MRCSVCSEEVRPVVAVDIDGTLGDYHSHFIDFAEIYLGRLADDDAFDGATSGSATPFKDWALIAFRISEAEWKAVKLAYRQGGLKRSMPVYTGAAGLCEGVRDAGAELWLTTTRPYLRLDNIDPDTRHWLERNSIEYDGLLYGPDKYQSLADRIDRERVVAVLDDLVEQAHAAAGTFGADTAILRRTKYNKAVRWGGDDAEQLTDAKYRIMERIEAWKESH